MNKNTKRIVITILIIVSIITFFFVSKELKSKKIEKLPEVKLKEMNKKNNMFAVMVEKEDNNYEEYKEEGWPGSDYVYKEAKCIDNKGSLINENIITFENDTVALETDKTVYCTLYFDTKKFTTKDIVASKPVGLSQTLVGNLYRYQGIDKKYNNQTDNPNNLPIIDNNFICFGTNSKNECLNNEEKYMYRIIGITKDGEIKVIKKSKIIDNGTFLFKYNTNYLIADCPNNSCEWPNVELYKRLNGISNATDSSNSNIFVNSESYDYIYTKNTNHQENSYWYTLINDHQWMYGDVFSVNNDGAYSADGDGITLYKLETGQLPTHHLVNNSWVKYSWNQNTDAKIGIMYLHDYYLAYDNDRNWYKNYDKTNWILLENNDTDGQNESLIPRDGYVAGASYLLWRISTTGQVNNYKSLNDVYAVRPVFYISKDVVLTGQGNEDNPYMIVKNR